MVQSYYPNEDTNLNIARGLVKGTFGVHKQGAVQELSQNQTGTVWGYNDTKYPWSAWDAGANTVVITSDALDVGKFLTIEGLDSNFETVKEDVNLSSTVVTTNTEFSRINFMYVHNGGTNNIKDIVLNTNGANVAIVKANTGQALMGVYTVPAGYTAYITKGVMSCQASADGTGNMYIRFKEGYFAENTVTGFITAHTFEVSGAGGKYCYDFTIPQAIPEKSDIDIQVTTRTNNGRFTCAWDMILIKNGLS
jgi:hypothetical protein